MVHPIRRRLDDHVVLRFPGRVGHNLLRKAGFENREGERREHRDRHGVRYQTNN